MIFQKCTAGKKKARSADRAQENFLMLELTPPDQFYICVLHFKHVLYFISLFDGDKSNYDFVISKYFEILFCYLE